MVHVIDFIDINFYNNQLAISTFRKKTGSVSIEMYIHCVLLAMGKN